MWLTFMARFVSFFPLSEMHSHLPAVVCGDLSRMVFSHPAASDVNCD
jgi:hypothetical protein